jgi:hypothetical protein
MERNAAIFWRHEEAPASSPSRCAAEARGEGGGRAEREGDELRRGASVALIFTRGKLLLNVGAKTII